MVRIAIVDDDSDILLLIRQNMADAIDFIQVETETFECAKDFLNVMAQGSTFDILLTDISLPDMNGVELGKIVRERWPDMNLVFLTSYEEYAVESYNIEADQYILKKNMGSRLWKVLKYLIERRSVGNSNYRVVSTMNNDISEKRLVYCYEIVFASKVKGSKYVEYTTLNGQYRERVTLDVLKRELGEEDFILVDRSYIVNIKHIIKISNRTIYLRGNHQVTVSRAHYTEVKQQIHDYGRRR